MLDEFWWQYGGTGHETGPETRIKPNPGYHYYEHGQTRGERLEDLIGIRMRDARDRYFDTHEIQLGGGYE